MFHSSDVSSVVVDDVVAVVVVVVVLCRWLGSAHTYGERKGRGAAIWPEERRGKEWREYVLRVEEEGEMEGE